MMPARTYVYIDGFNLYYRSLKGTAYKWLDVFKLASILLPPEKHEIIKVKLFTARIKGGVSDIDATNRQDIYLRALQASHPDTIEIIYGTFLSHPASRPYAPPNSGMANVILTEEKGTDVNLAVHLLNDAWLNLYDCAAVMSNDSDLAQAMQFAKERSKLIGWVVTDSNHPSQKLKSIPHFTKMIRKNVLAASQLPRVIPGTSIKKPQAWDLGKT